MEANIQILSYYNDPPVMYDYPCKTFYFYTERRAIANSISCDANGCPAWDYLDPNINASNPSHLCSYHKKN